VAVVSAPNVHDRKPASKLRLARVAEGWGVGALAAAIDVAESTIWRIETGAIKEPRPWIRRALARKLGVSVSKLFGKASRP
jgi:DNA-binding XRE family transcriptional regulator